MSAVERIREALRLARERWNERMTVLLDTPSDDPRLGDLAALAREGDFIIRATDALLQEAQRERDYFQSRLPHFSAVAQEDFARAEAAEEELGRLRALWEQVDQGARLAAEERVRAALQAGERA